MKRVEVTVMPNRLDSVLNALTKAGFFNLTYFEGKGRSHQKGEKKMWRGQEYREIYGRIIQMILMINNKDIYRVIDIIKNASGDEDGDNLICVTEVEDLVNSETDKKRVEPLPWRIGEVI